MKQESKTALSKYYEELCETYHKILEVAQEENLIDEKLDDADAPNWKINVAANSLYCAIEDYQTGLYWLNIKVKNKL